MVIREQSNAEYSDSESSRDMNVDQQSRSVSTKFPRASDSSEVNTEDGVSFYKHFNFTMLHANEEVEHSTYYILEIHINNSVVRRNAAEEYLNHSCLMAMINDQNDCMNISLQLKSNVEYPMCMTKIIWLSMIPVVIVLTVSVVIYKIVQENGQNLKTNKQLIPLTAQDMKILPVIPEQEHCRLSTSTVEVQKHMDMPLPT
ncbi:UNVERIFIED_CONTAM: hypothetical protein H355_002988 [Colinus virginianus]|nr:hypothetical protein H355_002988 [Colinus virginianus]